MLQANPNSSVLTVSPPDSGFSPRREFVRDSHVPSTFALLAIAGSGFVRLSSFSDQVVSALRDAFDLSGLLRAARRDDDLKLIEFNLEGKPWTQTKNADSEKLFIQILAIIFHHGYRFLSTIDYGRESSERVSIAFSRPTVLSAYEATRVPFALSFPSSTVLRVINPPLNSSPAILQAARSAWPRGVESEKTVSDKIFEFRLKGYGLFQEDTFSTDSMKHVLALLNALDQHGFTLLTSLSLSGSHSRVKDLWIFSGSPLEPSSELGASGSSPELSRGFTPTGSKSALSPVWTSSSSQGNNHSADTLHGKGGSLPGSTHGSSHTLGHARSATEPAASPLGRTPSVLHKKNSPKPLRTLPYPNSRFSRSSEEFPIRRYNLSKIGSIDMTGIGSANQRSFVAGNANGAARSLSPQDFPRSSIESDPSQGYRDPHQAERGRVKTGDLFYETGPNSTTQQPQMTFSEAIGKDVQAIGHSSPGGSSSESRHSSNHLSPRDLTEPPEDVPQSVSQRVVSDASSVTPPILNSGVFRDSAFSSSTNRSYEIPIKWTGAPDGEKDKDSRPFSYSRLPIERNSSSPETDEGYGGSVENGAPPTQRPSSTPTFPGAWQPTPIVEIPEDQGGLASSDAAENERSPERKEVDAERVASPIASDFPEANRKSEAGLISEMPQPTHPTTEEKRRSSNIPSSPTKSDGWVLVSVADGVTDKRTSGLSGERPTSPSSSSDNSRSKSPKPVASSLSPIAKAIVLEDAKHPANKDNDTRSTSTLKRIFSVTKSKTRQPPVAQAAVHDKDGRARKMSIRERWLKKTSTST
ncbi:uncharacterized protein FOMMEDRAFT_167393 [Fomitiporia mediterranea MF3/22]|uniref:uncharacterized protein n=1 Tax=Fomitiporia mediterranea (strain MF3/22) TaxID=694068 RepID=UPI0004409CBF|nr:uncharacterized protein FOMMEDRAFT_167393 [Fomitiporia mediterranea MF3/22]EJD04147.1 hypothetical protein FOMMEDRAFT_167393 [Fomitiporia mediterranea MF3/22]